MDNYEAAIRFEATIKETFETELNRIGNEVIEEKMQEIRKEIELSLIHISEPTRH